MTSRGPAETLLAIASATLARLPEAPLVAAAESVGELWYRVAPGRRAQARANLHRVAVHLAATGHGPASARRAADDPAALDRLVRACFRHTARYYLEVARTGGYDVATALERLTIDQEAELRERLATGPIMLIGMHLGAIELPVVAISSMAGRPFTAPMETLTNRAIQAWFVASRSRVGVHVVPLTGARRALLDAVRRGDPVGMVADRDLAGGGLPVPFLGHPAPFPAGPALLALEAGIPLCVGVARRTRDRRYQGRVIFVPDPAGGSRRERVHALTAGMVAAFEELIADAPEQWWGAFHPVWPDLAVHGGGRDRPDGHG